MIHELKTWPHYFNEVFAGRKLFEVRENDRDYKAGDDLLLREYSQIDDSYSGREVLCNVTYVLYGGGFGITANHVVMSINIKSTNPETDLLKIKTKEK